MAHSPFDLPQVDELYDEHPGGFVSARDRIAAALRQDGDKDVAAAVRRLRKPTTAAWAVNQAARARPDDVRELISLGSRLRDAQTSAMEGGSRKDLEAAEDERRTLLRSLVADATDVAGGHRDAVRATLDAASLDADHQDALQHGRLTTALDPPSRFELGTGGIAPAPRARERTTSKERQRRQRELERAESEVQKRTQRRAAAERELIDARRALEAADADLATAVQRRDELADDVSRSARD